MPKLTIITTVLAALLCTSTSNLYAGGGKPNLPGQQPGNSKPGNNKPGQPASRGQACEVVEQDQDQCAGTHRAKIKKCPGKPPEVTCIH